MKDVSPSCRVWRIALAFALTALTASSAIAGEPVEGINISLEQIPGGISYTGETNTKNVLLATARAFEKIQFAIKNGPECDNACVDLAASMSSIADTIRALAATGPEIPLVSGQNCPDPGTPGSAGVVPDGGDSFGMPFTLAKAPGGDLDLRWDASCLGTDDDYAVYEGTLGDFSSHVPKTCSTIGETMTAINPGSTSHYYLVVPLSTTSEGSYGIDSLGTSRPASASSCLPQQTEDCPA